MRCVQPTGGVSKATRLEERKVHRLGQQELRSSRVRAATCEERVTSHQPNVPGRRGAVCAGSSWLRVQISPRRPRQVKKTPFARAMCMLLSLKSAPSRKSLTCATTGTELLTLAPGVLALASE